MNEADTCRKYVAPKLLDAGWDSDPHSIAEQRSFTDGRIVVVGEKAHRRPRKRVDYLLRYTRDLPLAVVEAKANYKLPGDGLQQAKDYAEILGLKFAYSTNGHGIVEFDYTTGTESEIESFPSPDELWSRFRLAEKLTSDDTAGRLLIPANLTTGKEPRYYQRIAIQRAVEAIARGKRPRAAHDGYRYRQDGRRVPDLLDAVVVALEPDRRASQAAHPVPCRPQLSRRRSEGKDLHALRRRAAQD